MEELKYLDANKLILQRVKSRQKLIKNHFDAIFVEVMRYIQKGDCQLKDLYIETIVKATTSALIVVHLSSFLEKNGFQSSDEYTEEAMKFVNRFKNLDYKYSWDGSKLSLNFYQ